MAGDSRTAFTGESPVPASRRAASCSLRHARTRRYSTKSAGETANRPRTAVGWRGTIIAWALEISVGIVAASCLARLRSTRPSVCEDGHEGAANKAAWLTLSSGVCGCSPKSSAARVARRRRCVMYYIIGAVVCSIGSSAYAIATHGAPETRGLRWPPQTPPMMCAAWPIAKAGAQNTASRNTASMRTSNRATAPFEGSAPALSSPPAAPSERSAGRCAPDVRSFRISFVTC